MSKADRKEYIAKRIKTNKSEGFYPFQLTDEESRFIFISVTQNR